MNISRQPAASTLPSTLPHNSLGTLQDASHLRPYQVGLVISYPGRLPFQLLSSISTNLSQGIYYFATHRFLWPLFKARLVPIVLLSSFVYFLLFFFTYLPQVAFLSIFQGAGAWINGAFLVLGEGAAIVAALFEAFFVDETLVDIFDSVLVNEGQEELVLASRVIYPEGDDPTNRLGTPTTNAVYAPFSLRQILEFILLLPLNFIPVAGTPMFLVLTGYRGGPFHHWRYYQLLDYSKQQRKESISRRQLQYTTFVTFH